MRLCYHRDAARATFDGDKLESRTEELRTIILDVLATRLEPPLAAYRRIEARVAAINEIERLRNLVQAVVSAANAAEFEQALGG